MIAGHRDLGIVTGASMTYQSEISGFWAKGDTLGRIAKMIYGEFRLWPLIFEANRDKISSPNLIRVGMELLIPPRE